MKNPAAIVPGAMQAIQALMASVQNAGTPPESLRLAHLRAGQINGCSPCVDGGFKHTKEAGESEERLFAVAAWRDAPYFSDGERAALARAEAVTYLADRSDPAPDPVWAEAAKHYDGRARWDRALDRDDEPLQPPQCRHPANRRSRLVSGGCPDHSGDPSPQAQRQ